MEQIKKKMAGLKAQLEEAEGRAQSAEDELQNASDRASSVSYLFTISFDFCLFVCCWNVADLRLKSYSSFS